MSKELKARKSAKDVVPEKQEHLLNVVSSKVTLEEKTTALDNLLARVASDHVVDMGTNTTHLDQPVQTNTLTNQQQNNPQAS